ncbi:MAG: DsbA family protein [Acidobacteria bacterium]|nr:DsbA family protein [Acidobacteriota bacterium]
MLREYPEDVRIVYKQHPLPMHSNAALAAEAALAAHAQGKFLAMHEAMLENFRTLSREKILELAAAIGLDVDRFRAEIDSGKHKAAVEAETREVTSVGAGGTPASFVNGRFVSGAQPYDVFKKLIDEELQKAKAGS